MTQVMARTREKPPLSDTDLHYWVASALNLDPNQVTLALIAGDASPRRYYRVAGDHGLAVVAPNTQTHRSFLQVRDVLAAARVAVPEVYAAALDRGFLLIEDFGDDLLLPILSPHSVGAWYGMALKSLTQIVAIDPSETDLPHFDVAFIRRELDLCPEWFVQGLLGITPSPDFQGAFEALVATLTASITEQPQVVMHRDYHSRNLLCLMNGGLGVIDFQDAVIGPVTYDPVSLLKDCYIAWPRRRQVAWLADYRAALEERGQLANVTEHQFLRWFDLTGLQRHLKVLGIFARLHLRDGKSGYLPDLPRVLAYVTEVLALYAPTDPTIAEFHARFAADLLPAVRRASWFEGPFAEALNSEDAFSDGALLDDPGFEGGL